jgi:hypothetical protein
MNDEPLEITLLVIAALEQLRIKYLIGGSLASSIYGEPRATRDADLLADIKAEHVQLLCKMLEAQFNISDEAIRNALKYRSSFNLIHYESLFKVDIFMPKDRQFDERQFQRMSLHVVALNPERQAYVASAEDVILAKLDWYRQGNEASGQQWRDVIGILKANEGAIDLDYLRQTANELGVSALLQRLIPESPN